MDGYESGARALAGTLGYSTQKKILLMVATAWILIHYDFEIRFDA